MSESVRQFSFSGGEIAPAMYARTDLVKYETGLRTLRNRICMRHGGVTGRPGTQYVATTLNGNNTIRFIPFIFNETGTGQSYILEFGNLYIAFYQNGGRVESPPGIPYTIVSPYAQADIATLKFAESADVITITHPSYAPRELRRLAATNWTITTPALDSQTAGPTGLIASGGGAGTLNFIYLVTAVDSTNGDESNYEVSRTANVSGGSTAVVNVAALSVANPVHLTWNVVANALAYRIYKLDATGGTLPNFGFIAETVTNSWYDTGIDPDYGNQPPHISPFFTQGVGNRPSAVGFIQQRRVFAATNNNPLGVWASKPGSYQNFDYHPVGSVPDDDPYVFSIAGEEVNAIQHVFELKFFLMLTSGAEIYVQGNGSGVVTPSAINASTQSQYGAAPLRPLKVGDVLLFNQALGAFIRDFSFDFAIDGYRGNDITVFSSHLFEGYSITDWTFQKIPDYIIWSARSDGKSLSCTYLREQQILSWARHDFTNGFVENVCAIPENGNYAVYFCIRRIINGGTVRYIERMSSRLWSDPIDSSYLDSFLKYDGRNASAVTINQFQIIAGVNDAIDLQLVVDGSIHSAFIAAGAYTGATLATAIASALNALNIQVGGVGTSWGCAYSGGFIDIYTNAAFPLSNYNYRLLWGTGPYVQSNAAISLGWLQSDTAYSTNPGPFTYDQIAPSVPSPARSFLVTMTLTASGSFQAGNTAYQQSLTLTASSAFFNSGMLGNQIFLQNDLFVSSQASKGEQVRCTIQSFVSSTVVTVTPNKTVPEEFQNIPTTNWERAVKTVSGLSHLEGQEVSVWADRFVVGSPLNNQISNVYTVASGSITLDKCYAVIYVGLPMVQDFETLDLETIGGATMLAKPKLTGRVNLFTYRSRSMFAGSENPDTNRDNTTDDPLFQLIEQMQEGERETYDQPPNLLTGQDYITFDTHWNYGGRLFIRNLDPIPSTILSVAPEGLDPSQNAAYKRG